MQVYKRTLLSNESQPFRLTREDAASFIKERLIGISRWAEDTRAAIEVHAATDDPIIFEGEQGTGKEYIARLVHRCSARRDGPFVAMSFYSVPTDSIEATLFGSIRTLSSGCSYTQKGVVESAQGGTLFLNGLSSFSPSLQSKIARLIEYREFHRLGDERFEPADIRIILGSSQNSQPGSESGPASESVSISVSDSITIPALRQRLVDIEPLCKYFVQQTCQQLGKEIRELSFETLSFFRKYNWPGNIGELKKVIHNMVKQSRPLYLDRSLLPSRMLESADIKQTCLPAGEIDLAEEVKEFEVSLICAALKQCGGVQYKAAQLLKIKPTTLNMKILRFGIDVESLR